MLWKFPKRFNSDLGFIVVIIKKIAGLYYYYFRKGKYSAFIHLNRHEEVCFLRHTCEECWMEKKRLHTKRSSSHLLFPLVKISTSFQFTQLKIILFSIYILSWVKTYIFRLDQILIHAVFYILPPSVKASVVLCSWLTWMPAPQGETSSFRNDLSCQPREDEATWQYAAVWLPTCAPHADCLNLSFAKMSFTSPSSCSPHVPLDEALFCLIMDGCSLSRWPLS